MRVGTECFGEQMDGIRPEDRENKIPGEKLGEPDSSFLLWCEWGMHPLESVKHWEKYLKNERAEIKLALELLWSKHKPKPLLMCDQCFSPVSGSICCCPRYNSHLWNHLLWCVYRGERSGWDQAEPWIIILELPAKNWCPSAHGHLDSSPLLPFHICSFIFYFRSIASSGLERGATSSFFWVYFSHWRCQHKYLQESIAALCKCCSSRVTSALHSSSFLLMLSGSQTMNLWQA